VLSPADHHRCTTAHLKQVPGRTPLRMPHYGQNRKQPRSAAGVLIARLTLGLRPARRTRLPGHAGRRGIAVNLPCTCMSPVSLSRISGSSQVRPESLSRERECNSLPSATAITRRPARPPRRGGGHGRKRVYGFLRRFRARYAPPANPAGGAAVPRRFRQEGLRSGFSGAGRSCIVSISATLPSSAGMRQSASRRLAADIPYGLARVPRQTRRVTTLSPAENISTICVERSGKPAGRSGNLRLGPARPAMTPLVWAFSLTLSAASTIFPARPSVNHRGHVHGRPPIVLPGHAFCAGQNFPAAGRRPIRPAPTRCH
jgi:hypothetical protein